MKPVSSQMLTLLASRQFFAVDLWTITLTDGLVMRFSAGDQNIVANGSVYSSGAQTGPYFDRTDNKAKLHWAVGTSVDTLVVDIIPGSFLVGTTPFLQAVREGLFDSATVMLERAYMPTWNDTTRGVVRMFVGRVAEFVAGRSIATMTVNSHLELLNQQFPRNLVQVTCMNELGDNCCGVNLASYETTGTVVGGTNVATFLANLVGSFPAGTFDGGTLTWNSGTNNGLQFGLSHVIFGASTQVNIAGFMPSIPGVGDTFTITYGCNKSYTDSNGCPKFGAGGGGFVGNEARFRAMPWVPQPSTAV